MLKACIAAILALTAATCVAAGDVLQQRVAYRFAGSSLGHIALLGRLLRHRQWRCGALLLAASVGLQAAALRVGSVLLVEALLVLSVLFALAINARYTRRPMTGPEWIWAGILTAAVIFIVTVGHPTAGHSIGSASTWAAVAALFGPVLVGCVAAARVCGGAVAAMLLAFVSGSLWGVFAVLAKQAIERSDGIWAMAHTTELYAGLLAALGGLVWGQAAFRAGPLTASMPALEVSQPLIAAVLGVAVLGETLNTGWLGLVALAATALVMAVALAKLARVEAAAADYEGQRRAARFARQRTREFSTV